MVSDKSFVNTFRLHVHTKIHIPPHTHTHTHTHMSSSFLGALAILRRQLDSSCVSVRIEKLSSHCTDIYEVWYLSIFRKSGEKIKVSVKFVKKNVYFTWRPMYIYNNISLNSSQSEKFSGNSCRENQNTYFTFINFSPKIVPKMRRCVKTWGQAGCKCQCNAAHALCMLDA